MGMYSSVCEGELGVIDEKGLANWTVEDAKRGIPKKFKKRFGEGGRDDVLQEYSYWLEEVKKKENQGELHMIFDDKKIISYWYEGFCFFLRDMAQFLQGYVVLEYEEPGEFARITWEDGQVFVEMAKAEFGDKHELEKFIDLPPLPDKEKLLRGL